MAVTPVCTRDIIFLLDGGTSPDGHGLLSDTEMNETRESVILEERIHPGLEFTNEHHLTELLG